MLQCRPRRFAFRLLGGPMICSRFDYYSPYFIIFFVLSTTGVVWVRRLRAPLFTFATKTFFSPLSAFLFAFLCFCSKKCGRIRFKCVYLCSHAVLVGQKVQQGVFHVKNVSQSFFGWFSSVRLRQGQVVEG